MTSIPFDQAAFAHTTTEVVLTILEIDNAELATPIRVVNNREDIIHNLETYQGFYFFIQKPTNMANELPRAQLSVCNVDQAIVEAVRSVQAPLDVVIKTILASSPNTIEDGPYTMKLRDVSYNRGVVSGSLMVEDIMNEPYPADIYDPTNAPGLF